jgi:hypothetical protein
MMVRTKREFAPTGSECLVTHCCIYVFTQGHTEFGWKNISYDALSQYCTFRNLKAANEQGVGDLSLLSR